MTGKACLQMLKQLEPRSPCYEKGTNILPRQPSSDQQLTDKSLTVSQLSVNTFVLRLGKLSADCDKCIWNISYKNCRNENQMKNDPYS